MNIKFIFTLVYIILPSILLAHCAQVVAGTAVKVVTVNQEERSIGEYVDDAIIKSITVTNIKITTQVVNAFPRLVLIHGLL